MRNLIIASAIALAAANAFGCAGSQPHVRSDAALGKVIIYRNGVAYFERSAHVQGDKLRLSVPADRIDDFLKSLTVVEASTGTALPVSFPAASRPSRTYSSKQEGSHDDSVDLNIQLPSSGARDLVLSYVTESPAWKPSYRVILGDKGRARIHAWAVVDNVSGEDWNKVTVGVGSTSALSFKYDLHSVRQVERETLHNESELAMAPPTGGSPYSVGGKPVTVVGNIRADQIEGFRQRQSYESASAANVATGNVQKDAPAKKGKKPTDGAGRRPATEPPASQADYSGHLDVPVPELLPGLAALKGNNDRVRIEGYAQGGESDPRQSSLDRANVIRDQLIANGISAERIEAVGTGHVAKDGVRIVLVGDEGSPSQASSKSLGVRESEPLGNALFVSGTPMTLEDGRSAMVSLVQSETDARQVYYFDPVSSRGSHRFAFKAVRLVNPTQYTLEAGPYTVYAGGQFLGEGLSEPIPPKSVAFVPFGLDREVIVDPSESVREEISKLLTIQRGVVSTESQRIRQTKLILNNRGLAPADVYVRHAVPEGWTLKTAADRKFERLGGAYLFPVTVASKGSVELVIEEAMPIGKTVDIRTDLGVTAIELFLRSDRVDDSLKGKLDEIVRLHKDIANLKQKIETIDSQMQVYRARVDELHLQLVTLRQVPNAQQLSRNLAQKMEEISNRLQKATLEATELKGTLMTMQVGIQDRLAELTLSPEPSRKEGPSKTTTQ